MKDTAEHVSGSFDDGLAIRQQVLGEAHVNRALECAGDFDREIQELVTTYGWGVFWKRDGLDRKTKSMITVAMLVALGRHDELEGHVRGALNNGMTVEELRSTLIHSMLYCGAPAALAAFRTARKVVDQYTAGPLSARTSS